jgi:hypothetical protein
MRRMNAQMPKHRVDLSTPMLLYGTQAATARTGSRLCDKGFNLVLRNLRLEPPDQTFALIVREAQVGLRGQIWPFNIANDRRLQIASIVNAFELHHPIHGGPLRREIPEPYGSFSPDPQLLSGLFTKVSRVDAAGQEAIICLYDGQLRTRPFDLCRPPGSAGGRKQCAGLPP